LIYFFIKKISFILIRAHTNFQDFRTTPSGRKVLRRREKDRKEERKKRVKKTMKLVATTFVMQPVSNTAHTSLLGPISVKHSQMLE
jgi:hypothetical protein